MVAYEELKGKLEHMVSLCQTSSILILSTLVPLCWYIPCWKHWQQSRIKEAANALKPCLNAESPAIALAALQELEELAAAGGDPVQQNW